MQAKDGMTADPQHEGLSDDALMREMAHMSQVIGRRARRAGGAAGVPFVLAILASHEEAVAEGFATRLLSQVELADIVGIRPQSLGALLAKLEDEGCIERHLREGDKRAHLVALTARGRERAQEARECQRALARETLAVLDAKEKRQLASIVLKLNAALR